VQRLIGAFGQMGAAPAPRYRTHPYVVYNVRRQTVSTIVPRQPGQPPWSGRTHYHRPSDITGLDDRVTGSYRPVTRSMAQTVVGKYKSIPGGITLEGSSPDLSFIKSVVYLPQPNAFILNDDIVYLNPVTPDEFLQIARALTADDKMGVSIGDSVAIVYGKLAPQSIVARNLKLADSFLGGIAFGDTSRARGYVWAPGFEAVTSLGGSNVAVYFNVNDFRFAEDPAGELRRSGAKVDVTLVPLTEKKAADGGHGPDFDRIERGDIPAAFVANVQHLQNNMAYYMRERIVRTTFAYGEIAAFARALKENAVSVGARSP
jgi:hypothetical protein